MNLKKGLLYLAFLATTSMSMTSCAVSAGAGIGNRESTSQRDDRRQKEDEYDYEAARQEILDHYTQDVREEIYKKTDKRPWAEDPDFQAMVDRAQTQKNTMYNQQIPASKVAHQAVTQAQIQYTGAYAQQMNTMRHYMQGATTQQQRNQYAMQMENLSIGYATTMTNFALRHKQINTQLEGVLKTSHDGFMNYVRAVDQQFANKDPYKHMVHKPLSDDDYEQVLESAGTKAAQDASVKQTENNSAKEGAKQSRTYGPKKKTP